MTFRLSDYPLAIRNLLTQIMHHSSLVFLKNRENMYGWRSN